MCAALVTTEEASHGGGTSDVPDQFRVGMRPQKTRTTPMRIRRARSSTFWAGNWLLHNELANEGSALIFKPGVRPKTITSCEGTANLIHSMPMLTTAVVSLSTL